MGSEIAENVVIKIANADLITTFVFYIKNAVYRATSLFLEKQHYRLESLLDDNSVVDLESPEDFLSRNYTLLDPERLLILKESLDSVLDEFDLTLSKLGVNSKEQACFVRWLLIKAPSERYLEFLPMALRSRVKFIRSLIQFNSENAASAKELAGELTTHRSLASQQGLA